LLRVSEWISGTALVVKHHPLETRTGLDFAVPHKHRRIFIDREFDQLKAMDVDAPGKVRE
jgi:hypothetical protein